MWWDTLGFTRVGEQWLETRLGEAHELGGGDAAEAGAEPKHPCLKFWWGFHQERQPQSLASEPELHSGGALHVQVTVGPRGAHPGHAKGSNRATEQREAVLATCEGGAHPARLGGTKPGSPHLPPSLHAPGV